MRNPLHTTKPSLLFFLYLLMLTAITRPLAAAELSLAVHPLLSAERTRQVYQPLVDYLSQASGQKIKLVTNINYLAHWQAMKREQYDLILDGPHFTAYRINKMNYTALAKFPGLMSHSLVAHEDNMILEPSELIGKTIATTASPALAALYLNLIFPNPMRQPNIVETPNVDQAAELAMQGKVAAAIIPTPIVARYPGLVTIYVTEQGPSLGISASPMLSAELQQSLRSALLDATNNPAGRKALESLTAETLEPANNSTFQDMDLLLEGTWGY